MHFLQGRFRKSMFNAYYQTTEDSNFTKHHDHNYHELILVERGEVDFSIENCLYTAKEHSLVVIGHLERHHCEVLQTPYQRRVMRIPNDFLIQYVRLPLLASFFLYRPKSFTHVLTLNDNLFEKVRERFDAIIEELRVELPLQEHQLGILLELLLMELFRNRPECFFNWQSTQDMTTIFHIQRYVARNFNQELTLAALADLFHVSPYWLSRSFRIITGSGFQQYLILCRLNEAKRLLLSTDLPITMVADYSGYRDVNNFIRAFRMHEKVTPLKFRKNGGA